MGLWDKPRAELNVLEGNMRKLRSIAAFIIAVAMLLVLTGCNRNSEFKVPGDMTREEAALFTAIAKVCPKDDNHSKVDYLTFHIEGWSFDTIPDEILSYLREYCENGNATMVQLSFDELKAQGFIESGDGGFFGKDEDTYKLGKGKIFTFTKDGDENADTLTVKLTGFISDNDTSGYDILLEYKKGAWQFVKFANAWGNAYMNTSEPSQTPDSPLK